MNRKSFFLLVLSGFVSLSGFVAGWLYRKGPNLRALVVLALTAAIVVVAGVLAAREKARVRVLAKNRQR
jgi:hypothetical protein